MTFITVILLAGSATRILTWWEHKTFKPCHLILKNTIQAAAVVEFNPNHSFTDLFITNWLHQIFIQQPYLR